MDIGLKPIRIELPEGNWWDIRPYLSREGDIRLTRLAQKRFKFKEGITGEEIIQNPTGAYVPAPEFLDISDEEDDLLLELATVAWSFSGPFSKEAQRSLPQKWMDTVLKKVKTVYGLNRQMGQLKKD